MDVKAPGHALQYCPICSVEFEEEEIESPEDIASHINHCLSIKLKLMRKETPSFDDTANNIHNPNAPPTATPAAASARIKRHRSTLETESLVLSCFRTFLRCATFPLPFVQLPKCVSLLRLIVCDKRDWWISFLLKETAPELRKNFSRFISEILRLLAAQERASNAYIYPTEEESQSICFDSHERCILPAPYPLRHQTSLTLQYIDFHLSLLDETRLYGEGASEYFHILVNFAMLGTPERQYLLRRHAVFWLIDYYLGEHSWYRPGKRASLFSGAHHNRPPDLRAFFSLLSLLVRASITNSNHSLPSFSLSPSPSSSSSKRSVEKASPIPSPVIGRANSATPSSSTTRLIEHPKITPELPPYARAEDLLPLDPVSSQFLWSEDVLASFMRMGYNSAAVTQMFRHMCFEDRAASNYLLYIAGKNISRITQPILMRDTLSVLQGILEMRDSLQMWRLLIMLNPLSPKEMKPTYDATGASTRSILYTLQVITQSPSAIEQISPIVVSDLSYFVLEMFASQPLALKELLKTAANALGEILYRVFKRLKDAQLNMKEADSVGLVIARLRVHLQKHHSKQAALLLFEPMLPAPVSDLFARVP